LLVSWCASDRCGMVGSDEDRGRSRRPSVEDQGWSGTGRVLGGRKNKRSGYSVAGRTRGQVMLCAVCTVQEETRSVGFLVEPQNQDRQFVNDLA
jgi:hypothetical protein